MHFIISETVRYIIFADNQFDRLKILIMRKHLNICSHHILTNAFFRIEIF